MRRWSARYPIFSLSVVILLIAAGVGGAYALGFFGPSGFGKPRPAGSCPSGLTLTGVGASFVGPLLSQWKESFAASTGNHVSYSSPGAGAGITALQSKSTDFAATDDPLNSSQLGGFQGATILTVPVTAGALAIVYNLPGISAPLSLSGTTIADIYLGKVTSWNDPEIAANNTGIGLPSDSIVTVHRQEAAGTTYVLTDFLAQVSPAWAAGPGRGIFVPFPQNPPTSIGILKNSALAAYVERTPDTIGYVDLTDVLNSPGLQYAKVSNPAGKFILPSLVDTASAIVTMSANLSLPALTDAAGWERVSMVNSPAPADYPLSTLAYFFLPAALDRSYQPSLAKAQVIAQWLNWSIGPGQGFSSPLFYVPLQEPILSADRNGLGSLTYNGLPIPTCR